MPICHARGSNNKLMVLVHIWLILTSEVVGNLALGANNSPN